MYQFYFGNYGNAEMSAEEVQRLRMQVLRNLIDETLQIQEAKAASIEVENEEVDQTFARVAQTNFNQSVESLSAYLTSIGSSPTYTASTSRSRAAWPATSS